MEMPHLNASKAIEVLSGSSARACCPRPTGNFALKSGAEVPGGGWCWIMYIISLVMYIYIWYASYIYIYIIYVQIYVYLNKHYIHIQSFDSFLCMTQPLSVEEQISRVQPWICFHGSGRVFSYKKIHLAAFWSTTLTMDMICYVCLFHFYAFLPSLRLQNSPHGDKILEGFESFQTFPNQQPTVPTTLSGGKFSLISGEVCPGQDASMFFSCRGLAPLWAFPLWDKSIWTLKAQKLPGPVLGNDGVGTGGASHQPNPPEKKMPRADPSNGNHCCCSHHCWSITLEFTQNCCESMDWWLVCLLKRLYVLVTRWGSVVKLS